jgi:hypothetical protein
MVNPDGVIHGNTRAELTGIDPNRVWKKPSKAVTPTISALKKQIIKNRDQVCMILDLHSHSKKIGCFFYGNEILSNSKVSKIYPAMVCEDDIRFTFKNCRFRGGYDTTARKVLYKELNIPNIYTV